MLTYKIANIEDTLFEPVFDLCKEAALAINGTIEEEALRNTVASFFFPEENYSNQVLLLAYDEEKPVGVLAGVRVLSHFLYGDKMCMELVLWIDPEYRSTRASHKLIKAYETWAEQVGCTKLVLSDIHDNERLRSMYEKKGYKKMETSFIKDTE